MDIIVKKSDIKGSIDGIASKSYAQRAIFCSILSRGVSKIEIDTMSNDIKSAIEVAESIGCIVNRDTDVFTIDSTVLNGESANLNVHESGTTLRFLIPLVAVLGINGEITREGTLIGRTNKVYFDTFPKHNVGISEENEKIFLSGKLNAGVFNVQGNISSQFISGLLIALGSLKEKSEIFLSSSLESKPYVNMTIDVMRKFGAKVEIRENSYVVYGGYSSCNYIVEKDWSNALFFLCAGVEVKGLNLLSKQADKKALIFLEKLGFINVSKDNVRLERIKEPERIRVLDARDMPDSVPILSVISAITEGRTKVINIKRLKLKESDRVKSTISMLNALGVEVYEDNEYFLFDGVKSFKSCTVDSYNDHRIAMSAAIAAKFSDDYVKIINAESVDKSYVGFFEDMKKLGGAIDVI